MLISEFSTFLPSYREVEIVHDRDHSKRIGGGVPSSRGRNPDTPEILHQLNVAS